MMKMIKYIYYFLIYLTNSPPFSFIVNTCEECGKSSFSSFLRIFWFSPPRIRDGFPTGVFNFLNTTEEDLSIQKIFTVFYAPFGRVFYSGNHSY